MNKRIAVRMLKAAQAEIGVNFNYTCNAMKDNVRTMERNAVVNADTLREYENTLIQLLNWISIQLEYDYNTSETLENFMSIKYNIDWTKKDMVELRKTWIGFMIEDVVAGEKLGKKTIDRMNFKTHNKKE